MKFKPPTGKHMTGMDQSETASEESCGWNLPVGQNNGWGIDLAYIAILNMGDRIIANLTEPVIPYCCS